MFKSIKIFVLICFISVMIISNSSAAIDRAVQIAKKARDDVEYSGKNLKYASDKVFKAFAEKTSELQKLMDTQKHLEQAGLLDSNDKLGIARKRNINAKIMECIGELKQICDENLDELLSALDRFDRTIVNSISDSQATRSINTNYELSLDKYLKKAKNRFEIAMKNARNYLRQCDNGKNKRACENYKRAKIRIQRINERRKLYETRMMVVTNNQKLSNAIRKQIKNKGFVISSKLRGLISKLYITFSKVSPMTVSMGNNPEASFGSIKIGSLDEFSHTLEIVDNSLSKLNNYMNKMVNDVVGGLSNISEVSGDYSPQQFSTEEELQYLQNMRKQWAKK